MAAAALANDDVGDMTDGDGGGGGATGGDKKDADDVDDAEGEATDAACACDGVALVEADDDAVLEAASVAAAP